MAIYKSISAKFIIAKIHRDIGLEDLNYTADIVEWIGEALEFIGSATQLVPKTATLLVDSHKAVLPEDFVQLQQLRYKTDQGGYIYLRYNPTSFNPHNGASPNWQAKTEETYSLTPGYIQFDFEKGQAQVSYLALPTDDEGFPLVPDNQYFREALMWYCLYKLLMRGYTPKSKDITLEAAQHQWKFYCSGARNQANYPDIGQYQRFADTWVGLIPNNKLFDSGFNLDNPVGVEKDTIHTGNVVTVPQKINKTTNIDGGTIG